MTGGFLDANIFVYHLLQNDERISPRCTAFFDLLEAGRAQARCSSTVVLETVFVLEKRFRVPRSEAFSPLIDLVSIPTISFDPESRRPILDALIFWKDNPPLSFADSYHLVLAAHLGLDEIYTFDKKMNRFPGVTRIEP